MTVRIQVIQVYDIEVPDECEDPIAFAYCLKTKEIHETGKLVDSMTDYAEIVVDEYL